MLSLFIGTVTMSMASSLDRIKQERQDKERKARKAKFSRKVKRIKHDTRHALPVKESTPELVLEGPQSSEPPLQPKMHSMTTTLRAFRDSEINAEAADAHHSDDERSKGIWKHWKLIKSQTIGPSQRDQVQSDGDLSVAINRSNSARKFRNIVLTVQVLESSNQRMLKNKMKHVLLSALVDDVEPDVRLILDPSEHHLTGWTKRYAQLSRDGGAFVSHPHFKNVIILTIMVAAIVVGAETYSAVNANVSASLALTAINYMIISIFISEVVLKVVAEGLYPWTYFMDAWNVFDFLIVIGSIIPAGGGKAIYVLRLLRLIRILKLVKSLPQLAVIVNAMIMGMASIGFIGMILFLTFYVCAIAGIILFEQNDPFRFGSLHLAIITLFSAATLDTWCDSLYTNMFGCDIWGYHNLDFLCTNPTPRPAIAVIFFVCFTILTALVLLTLFIGVVTTSMDEAAKTQEAERQQQEKVREVSAKHCLSETTVTLYREVFDVLDVDKNGLLDIEEMKLALESIGHPRTPEAILVLFRSVNPESDGQDMDVSKFIHFIETLRRAKAPTKTSQYETGRRSLLASLFHSIRKSSQASTGGETHPETGYISLLRKMSSRLFHPHPPMSPKSMQAKEHKQSREVSSKEAHSKTCLPRIRKSARVQPTPVDVDTEDEKVTEKEDETLTARRLEFTHQRIMPDG
jgi:voltage-gated sodium channel